MVKAREGLFKSEYFGDDLNKIVPIEKVIIGREPIVQNFYIWE